MLDMVTGLSRRAHAAHHPELGRTRDPVYAAGAQHLIHEGYLPPAAP